MTLISVLIMGALSMSAVTTIFFTGVVATTDSRLFQAGAEAVALADACAEDGLQAIRDNSSFTGSVQVALGNGECEYTVTNTGGDSREVASSGTVGTIVRKVEVMIDAINPQINIVSWQQVADF